MGADVAVGVVQPSHDKVVTPTSYGRRRGHHRKRRIAEIRG